jgi:hypothetical protein
MAYALMASLVSWSHGRLSTCSAGGTADGRAHATEPRDGGAGIYDTMQSCIESGGERSRLNRVIDRVVVE